MFSFRMVFFPACDQVRVGFSISAYYVKVQPINQVGFTIDSS